MARITKQKAVEIIKDVFVCLGFDISKAEKPALAAIYELNDWYDEEVWISAAMALKRTYDGGFKIPVAAYWTKHFTEAHGNFINRNTKPPEVPKGDEKPTKEYFDQFMKIVKNIEKKHFEGKTK